MLNSLRRFFSILTIVSAALVVSAPAVFSLAPVSAQSQTETGQPYVEVEAEEESAEVPQWTYRFLIPAAVALTVVMIAGTVVMYFVKVVRGRYSVVE